MSLDFHLEGEESMQPCICSECGHEHMKESKPELFHRNITHNMARMAGAVGLYECLWRPDENEFIKARQIVDLLTAGLKELKLHGDKYKHLEPENGWGNMQGLIRFVEDVLEACKHYPDAKISACR